MKELYIVRHAKSSWSQPALEDFDRPLNPRGKRDAPEMGRRLTKLRVLPDMVLSSPAKRAISTAQLIIDEIGFPKDNIVRDLDFLHTSVAQMVRGLKKVPDDVGTLMVFGHNPGFTDLANYFSGVAIPNIPTCGVVAIRFEVAQWTQIGEGIGNMVLFDYPKKQS